MRRGAVRRRDTEVGRYFASVVGYWRSIYEDDTVYAVIHQERAARALEWIAALDIPAGARVLDAGCGAGVVSVALAERGYVVAAVDMVPEMVDSTRKLAEGRSQKDRIEAVVADVRDLPFADRSFSLVVGLGVLPWLDDPRRAVEEMSRVLQPGGFLLVTVDNVFRLHYQLDPRRALVLAPVRYLWRTVARTFGLSGEQQRPTLARLRAPSLLDADLRAVGMVKLRGATLGFGPFTFWNRQLFSRAVATRLHRQLQQLADLGVPIIDNLGSQYLVLAQAVAP